MTKTELINALTDEQRRAILKHFNTIYECDTLSSREEKIIYLSWLFKNDKVNFGGDGFQSFSDDVTDVDLMDYEIDIEDEENKGGVNLHVTHDFYQIDDLIKLL